MSKIKFTKEDARKILTDICEKENFTLIEPFIYVGSKTKIQIKCNTHNYLWNTEFHSLELGHYCKYCAAKKQSDITRTSQIVVESKVNEICLKNNYTLLKPIEYINIIKTKLHLKCNFDENEWYISYSELMRNKGCPECAKKYKNSENKINELLIENSLIFIRQYRNKEIFKNQSLDFYLPEYKIAIEYQGGQHFKPIGIFGGENSYNVNVIRDQRKYDICLKNGIKLFYFSYEKAYIPDVYLDKVYSDENELITEIKKVINNENK